MALNDGEKVENLAYNEAIISKGYMTLAGFLRFIWAPFFENEMVKSWVSFFLIYKQNVKMWRSVKKWLQMGFVNL